MEHTEPRKKTLAQGYDFYTEYDASLAEQERKKIEYIESRINYHHPQGVLKLYTGVIRERIFKTPVGMMYLRGLQEYLLEQEEINPEEVPPIPWYVSFNDELREETAPARKRIQPSQKKPKKSMALPLSVLLNVALCVAVIAMFVITLKADQPNIINYERCLLDKYSAWEQELTEREQGIREKELELKITE